MGQTRVQVELGWVLVGLSRVGLMIGLGLGKGSVGGQVRAG